MGSAAAAASDDDHGHRTQGRSPSPCPEPQHDGGENTKPKLTEEGRLVAKAAKDPSPPSPDSTVSVSDDGRHQVTQPRPAPRLLALTPSAPDLTPASSSSRFLLTSPTAKPASHPEDGGGNDLTRAVSMLSLAEAQLSPCKSGAAPRAADPSPSPPGSAVSSHHHHQEPEPEEDVVAWDNKRTHCRFLVSDNEAGLIIGVRGCAVTDIEARSGARVKLSRRNELLLGTDRRVVLVTGTFQQVMDAMELLLEKLLYQDDQDIDSHATVVLVVPQPCCGPLIGKGGAVIMSLTEVSEAEIQVSPQDISYGLNDRLVTITGPLDNQLRAIFLILFELLEQVGYSFTYADAMPNSPIRSAVDKDGKKSVTIVVADEHMGAVIGHTGRCINEISKVSGAWITTSAKGEFIPGTRDREVTMSGTTEAIRAAEAMIMHRVSVASGELRRRRAEGGCGKGGGGEKLLARLEEDAALRMDRLQLS